MPKPSTSDILAKYRRKIEREMGSYSPNSEEKSYSREYIKFKEDMLPEMSRYQRWTQTLGNLITLKVSKKDENKIKRYLDIAHLNVTPSQALTLAILSLLVSFLGFTLLTLSLYFIWDVFNLSFFFLGILSSLFIFYYTYSMPKRLANIWRLKASSQMVPALLYIIVYMKHTPNLERAIEFASEHLEVPLALDFKKVFYDVEIGKYTTIKQSMDNYLKTWQDYSPEFVEAFHLIESSLYQPGEASRIQTLEKSLDTILNGVYDKMLKFSRSVRSPLTNLYMLGIILPTLGLALLPLASTLLGNLLSWHHVFVLFNILIPFVVFYMASEVLMKRPGGHGESSVLELNPDYPKFKSKKPWLISGLISFPLLIIGLLPFLLQIQWLTDLLNLRSDYTLGELGLNFGSFAQILAFDFKTSSATGGLVGPFGPVGTFLSLFIPLSIGLFFAIAYKMKTKTLIKARNETKELEKEFTNSLFQLGNRLGDGIPAEVAFSRVASSTTGQKSNDFFMMVNQNVQKLGMSVEEALFNPKRGAIIYYPSQLISTSMRILVESVKKGLKVAARSLMAISDYVKNIHKISARLKDLLAEVVSDMKSNMTFLAPLLAGIVVGLSTMISTILNKLQGLVDSGSGETPIAGLGTLTDITSIFDVTLMIPPYFIQASIGIYIIQIIFILSKTLVSVDTGKDKLLEKYELSRNLKRGLFVYLVVAFFSILALTLLSSIALSGVGV